MLEELNRINIQILELRERFSKLSMSERWLLTDLEDSRDEIRVLINEGLVELEEGNN